MSYELHIIRPSADRPILEAEWEEVVARDSELVSESAASAINPRTGERVQVGLPGGASWTDPRTGQKLYLRLSAGHLSASNPSPAAIAKMKALAARLDAEVRGDEGEIY